MEGSFIEMKFDFRSKMEEAPKTSSYDEEEVLIQIDDDEQSENGNDKYCEYPVASPNTVIVRERDYLSLKHDTYLNDSVIDFYLNYVHQQILPKEYQDQVHIFSSFFYKRLLLEKPNSEKDLDLSVAEKRHARVSAWTKNVDIFSKSVLIIPICEDSHWYFLMVVGLPEVLPSSPVLADPFVVVLDSLGGQRKKTARIIRQYLASEFEAKQVEGECGFTDSDIPSIRPAKPEQPNGTDCGIYLLHYVEKIFADISKFLAPDLPNLEEWFSHEEVAKKRSEIAALVRNLSGEQNPNGHIQFPDIPFTEEEAYLESLENGMELDEIEEDDTIDILEDEEAEVNDNVRMAPDTERNYITETRILVPAKDPSTFKEFVNWDIEQDFKFNNEYKHIIKLNITNNNNVKNITNNNNDITNNNNANLVAEKTPKRGLKRPKPSSVLEEEIDNETYEQSSKKAKTETPANGRARVGYNLPTPDETTCKISSDWRDCCKTLCKLCNKPYPLTVMRSHTQSKHKIQISKYKEIYGPFEIIDIVYHKCQLCGKLVLLDGDHLGGHIKGVHKMKEAVYTDQYLIRNKNIKSSAKKLDFSKKLDSSESEISKFTDSHSASVRTEALNKLVDVKLEANLEENRE